LRRLVRPVRALFPIANSPEWQVKAWRELLLGEVQLLSQGAHRK